VGRRLSLTVDRGKWWTVTLDRADRANALSRDLVEQLHDVLDESATARPIALVLRGSRRHFSAGFDLSGIQHESDASLAHRFLRIGMLLERVQTAPHLTIAVIEGAAVGAGADLAAACDHRLADATATFRFPGSAFGVVLGTARLASLGATLALTPGRIVTPSTASGLVTGTPDELEDVVAAWSSTDPAARPALLDATRPSRPAHDAALAALARSVGVPGLRDRIAAYAGVSTTEGTA
jgi:enoyl-CoA hydratase